MSQGKKLRSLRQLLQENRVVLFFAFDLNQPAIHEPQVAVHAILRPTEIRGSELARECVCSGNDL
jgi:hypothetical protein